MMRRWAIFVLASMHLSACDILTKPPGGAVAGCYVSNGLPLVLATNGKAKFGNTEVSYQQRIESGVEVLIFQPKVNLTASKEGLLVSEGAIGSSIIGRVDRTVFGTDVLIFKTTGGVQSFSKAAC